MNINLFTSIKFTYCIEYLFVFWNSRYKYSSLTELVAACKCNEARGLACLLTEECIKPRLQNIIRDSGGKWNIPRSELTKDKELGSGHFGIVYKGVDIVVMYLLWNKFFHLIIFFGNFLNKIAYNLSSYLNQLNNECAGSVNKIIRIFIQFNIFFLYHSRNLER